MDVALIYDHFCPMVLMQLEDYGFCEKGEGNDYVLAGKLRYDPATRGGVNGGVPVNTHGGNLNEAYIIGMTHIVEGVEQVRGTAINQVEGRRIRAGLGRSGIASGLQPDPEERLTMGSRSIWSRALSRRADPDHHQPRYRTVLAGGEGASADRVPMCRLRHFRMPPSPYCPECSSTDKAWPTLPGTATVFSFAICNKNPKTGEPYVYVPLSSISTVRRVRG